MDKNSIEIMCGIFGCLVFGAWLTKFGMHYAYRKSCESTGLFRGFKEPDFSDFLTSSYNNMINRIVCLLPLIIRNKSAEARISGLAKKGRIIIYLCFLFFVFVLVLFVI